MTIDVYERCHSFARSRRRQKHTVEPDDIGSEMYMGWLHRGSPLKFSLKHLHIDAVRKLTGWSRNHKAVTDPMHGGFEIDAQHDSLTKETATPLDEKIYKDYTEREPTYDLRDLKDYRQEILHDTRFARIRRHKELDGKKGVTLQEFAHGMGKSPSSLASHFLNANIYARIEAQGLPYFRGKKKVLFPLNTAATIALTLSLRANNTQGIRFALFLILSQS